MKTSQCADDYQAVEIHLCMTFCSRNFHEFLIKIFPVDHILRSNTFDDQLRLLVQTADIVSALKFSLPCMIFSTWFT